PKSRRAAAEGSTQPRLPAVQRTRPGTLPPALSRRIPSSQVGRRRHRPSIRTHMPMKITRIETIPVQIPINPQRAIRGGRGAHTTSPFLLVKVHTDDGITGLGEVSCTPGWSGEDQFTAAHFIETLIAPQLLGQDPTEIE